MIKQNNNSGVIINAQQLKRFRKKLLGWYDHQARDLPWRRTNDPYVIWISEIMLQQTQVDTVVPYYQRFLKTLPTIRSLAQAKEEKLLKLWEGLGYYRRAKKLQKSACQIMDQFQGNLPQSAEQWRQLTGIGAYTAHAIASIAFQQPVAVLDGNVKRVLVRLTVFKHPINEKQSESVLWSLAERFLEKKRSGDFNQAMMECGAMICRDTLPKCKQCPVNFSCQAFKQDKVVNYPKKLPKLKIPLVIVAAALICDKKENY